jgi:hypothetical protein
MKSLYLFSREIFFMVVVNLMAAGLIVASSVAAQPLNKPDLLDGGNAWQVLPYWDASFVHTKAAPSHEICFVKRAIVGSQLRYIWYSYPFRGWIGRAAQEGDQVFMYGDFYPRKNLHYTMQWELVTYLPKDANIKDEGFGHWQLWSEGSLVDDAAYTSAYTRGGFFNVKLIRTGKRCPIIVADDKPLTELIPIEKTDESLQGVVEAEALKGEAQFAEEEDGKDDLIARLMKLLQEEQEKDDEKDE